MYGRGDPQMDRTICEIDVDQKEMTEEEFRKAVEESNRVNAELSDYYLCLADVPISLSRAHPSNPNASQRHTSNVEQATIGRIRRIGMRKKGAPNGASSCTPFASLSNEATLNLNSKAAKTSLNGSPNFRKTIAQIA